MQRITPPQASAADVETAIIEHAADRRLILGAEMAEAMRADLLPDCGPVAESVGGNRLLRADTELRLVRTRYF